MTRSSWTSIFSFSNLLLAGIVVITCLTVSGRFDDPDLWWHLKTGEIISSTHAIPVTDVFSYTTHNHAWTAHEWLAQLSIYAAWHLAGYSGLMAWLSTLSSLLFIGVFILCRMQGGTPLTAFLSSVAAWFFGTVGLAIRPLIVGHLFLVIELLLLELGRRRDRRWLWLLPPLFALWVNCHGSYFFGMAVLSIYWVCSFVNGAWGVIVSKGWDLPGRRLLLTVLVLCGLALCANPIGPKLLLYPLDALFVHPIGVNVVAEWMPPGIMETRTIGILAVMAATALFGMLGRSVVPNPELDLRQLLLLGAGFVLACQHSRMAFLFGILAAPVICRLLEPFLGDEGQGKLWVANAVLMVGCAAAIVHWFPTVSDMQQQVRKTSPVAAVEYIRRAGLHGPMLNEYVFGGYLIWALPEEKVFIDGRADVFEWVGVLQEYMRWSGLAEDPSRLLDKYNIRFCLVSAGSPMVSVLPYLPGWKKVYSDQVAVIFTR